MNLSHIFENEEEEEEEDEEEEKEEEKNFQIFPILESKSNKLDNLIIMNLERFQFDSFIIIQVMILEMKEQNIFQIHYNIMLRYYH